jgi:hypothetical protein
LIISESASLLEQCPRETLPLVKSLIEDVICYHKSAQKMLTLFLSQHFIIYFQPCGVLPAYKGLKLYFLFSFGCFMLFPAPLLPG